MRDGITRGRRTHILLMGRGADVPTRILPALPALRRPKPGWSCRDLCAGGGDSGSGRPAGAPSEPALPGSLPDPAFSGAALQRQVEGKRETEGTSAQEPNHRWDPSAVAIGEEAGAGAVRRGCSCPAGNPPPSRVSRSSHRDRASLSVPGPEGAAEGSPVPVAAGTRSDAGADGTGWQPKGRGNCWRPP